MTLNDLKLSNLVFNTQLQGGSCLKADLGDDAEASAPMNKASLVRWISNFLPMGNWT